MVSSDDIHRLRCEKIVNESWSKARELYDELENIIHKGKYENEREYTILMIAANAALQQMTLDNVDDEVYFA